MSRQNNNTPKSFLDTFYDVHESDMQRKISNIEDIFANARDQEKIPIYMTRSRVKSYESSYLKTKRKQKTDIGQITDLLGIRVLCLFKQDIFEVYDFLLRHLNNNSKELTEVIIYHNEEKNEYKNLFQEIINIKKHKNVEFEFVADKGSYQSIHITGYLTCETDSSISLPFELQLRTLLQDVWGELEHKLSYKKNPHSFIIQSFDLLARDLQTNDMLLSNLYDLSNQDSCPKSSGDFLPLHVFRYDNNKFPAIFKDSQYKNLYEKYIKYIYNPLFTESSKNNMQNAKQVYDEIKHSFYKNKIDTDKFEIKYWIEMEKAFFQLCLDAKNNISEAEFIYLKYWKKSYVASFRLGQINSHNNNLVDALKFFDYSKKLVLNEINLSKNENDISLNKIKIHTNIALVYWRLGSEYQQCILDEINQAIKIYEEGKGKLSLSEENTLFNSATWYYMEILDNTEVKNYSKNTYDIDIDEYFSTYFNKLLNATSLLMEQESDSTMLVDRETLDSIAMCYFSLFKKNGDKEDINNAYKYMGMLFKRENIGFSYYENEDMFREHYREVECAYMKSKEY